MPKIEVKRVQSSMTTNDMEPHWVAVVDYGAFEVSIPLPARYLIDDDVETQTREFASAMESLAEALLRFADHIRNNGRAIRTDLATDHIAHQVTPCVKLALGGLDHTLPIHDL